MRTKIYIFLFCVLGSYSKANAQLSDAFLLDNAATSGVQQMFYKNKVLQVGNFTYTCGATINNDGNYDILLTKFDVVSGVMIWSRLYDGAYDGDDYAADLAVDGSNNVIVVGTTQTGSLDYDAIVIKYNSSGVQQWASTYSGAAGGPDGFTTVVLNGTDIYAAGGALVNVSNMTDVLCAKYNASGIQQWANTWNNGANNFQDVAINMTIGLANLTIFAATQETLIDTNYGVAILKISQSTGAITNTSVTSIGSTLFSEVKNIALDDSENIYVCGTRIVSGQSKNIYVAKYIANLTQVWSYTKNGSASTDDEGLDLKLSGTDVFITGYTSITAQGKNIYAAKLAQSTGAVSWEINNNLAGGDDEAIGIELDGNNNLIIPCTVDRNGTKDIGLLKLNHTTGAVITSAFYNGESNRNDYARDIAVNIATGDVYWNSYLSVES